MLKLANRSPELLSFSVFYNLQLARLVFEIIPGN